ncbi:response regulator [Ponticoccus sp. (in: a-proteobacteria)]|uniref:response regulator n=1 Tax=Ponticoccus sp. (in: a-proteobacteria) TaxID=1925025 RepID=UPI003AB80D9A
MSDKKAVEKAVCLIVDDIAFDRRMMRRVVGKSCPGLPMIVAHNLGEARRRLRERTVSILFLDNSLPDGRGVDFVSELAEDRDLRRVPVIIVSDFPSPFMYAKAQAANVREVWSKREFVAPAVQRAVRAHALH